MKPSTLKRFVRLDRFDEHLELHRLDCSSSHRNLDNYDFVRRFLAETPPEAGPPASAPDRRRPHIPGLRARAALQSDPGGR